MSAETLSNRENWQKHARVIGDAGEEKFASRIAKCLPPHYDIVLKPKKIPLYSGGRGVKLDSLIINNKTGKKLFIENKTGNNGGNAHERAYKYATPGIKKALRLFDPDLVDEPVYLIFAGKTFQGQKYQDEIATVLEGSNYAIMGVDFENLEEVANEIMEIV
jgi:hypothetical protein